MLLRRQRPGWWKKEKPRPMTSECKGKNFIPTVLCSIYTTYIYTNKTRVTASLRAAGRLSGRLSGVHYTYSTALSPEQDWNG